MINITGLWKNTSKDGTEYYSGICGGVKYLLFPNKKAQSDKAPVWNLCIDQAQQQQGGYKKKDQEQSTPEPFGSDPF